MRRLLLLVALAGPLSAQTVSPAPALVSPGVPTPLALAVAGRWVGVLEYRDYSEPPTSTKRVQLPTWLTVTAEPQGLRLEYTYDDGPSKTVQSTNTVSIDEAARTYKVSSTGGDAEIYQVSGLETLKDGRGTLTLSGNGTDNKQPAEVRMTWVIRRNLLTWLEEVRPAASSEPFTFRHRYTFTRAELPRSASASQPPNPAAK